MKMFINHRVNDIKYLKYFNILFKITNIFLDAVVNNVINIEVNNTTTKTKFLKRRNYQQTYENDCE